MKNSANANLPQLKEYSALSRQTGPETGTLSAIEPVLDIHEIQGNALPGFNKPHQSVLCLTMHDAKACKEFLKLIHPEISTLEEVLAFRRLYRSRKKRLGVKPAGLSAVWLNIAFSYHCIQQLTRDAEFESEAFKLGLSARSSLLGDPTDPKNEGNPKNWLTGGPDNPVDIFIIVGADEQAQVRAKLQNVKNMAATSNLDITFEEEMNTIEANGITGLEHFGFKDGISQPGVRGRLSDMPKDYLQERYILEDVLPDSLLYGYPGQFLCWPGEFIFGYHGESPDPLVPGQLKTEQPSWTKNGSFLVFRRYKQDVRKFWKFMQETSAELSKTGDFNKLNPQKLASMLIGRWPSGAPFSRVQDDDNQNLGKDQMANNYFRYGSDSCPIKLTNGYIDSFPQAKADPVGLTCPMVSHIRKVNSRDSSNDAGGTSASFNRRLLRRGLPFGPPLENPLDDKIEDPAKGNRGLIFISYQTSIENQFEFLRNRWMSNGFTPRSPSGNDLVIGLNGLVGENSERKGVIFDDKLSPVPIAVNEQWIMPTGGGYFFSPSLSAIRDILAM